jgi:hypothetical protein
VNPFGDLTCSFRGWAEIVAGNTTAGSNFRTDSGGLVAAAVTLLIAILLSVAAQSAVVGMPGPGQVLFGLLEQALTVGLLALVMGRTLKFLKLRVGLNTLLVPVLYALSYMFVLSIPLALLGPNAGLIALFGLALLIWRAAMMLTGLKNGPAVALALLCVIVLVVVPNALYMLLLLTPPA